MIQQLQHVPDVLRVLDNKVQLHVKFTADKLKRYKRVAISRKTTARLF